jgi:nicotinate-nucleotide adenylyltransferase
MTAARWLVFGGSFDPPHRAHVDLPRRAAESIGAERVLFIPAHLNPLKQQTPPASPEDRLAMLRLAIMGDPRCEIRTIEVDRGGPSYTVDTLRALAAEAAAAEPPARLSLLVGADAALGLPRWRDPAAIASLCEVAVMLRPPFDEGAFRRAYADAWREAGQPPAIEPRWVLDLGADPASSTAAREGEMDSLPPAVAAYIREHGLYSTPPHHRGG